MTRLDAALAASVREAHGGAGPADAPPAPRDGEREEMERRLVAKLEAAGASVTVK